MTEVALAQALIAALPTITVGITQLIAWITEVRKAAQQSAAWTPEMESAFLRALEATKTNPAYQPDSPANG